MGLLRKPMSVSTMGAGQLPHCGGTHDPLQPADSQRHAHAAGRAASAAPEVTAEIAANRRG